MTYSSFPCRLILIGTLFNQSESSKLKKMIYIKLNIYSFTLLISVPYVLGVKVIFKLNAFDTTGPRHTNDEYELFTHVHASKCVVTFVVRCDAAS